VETRFYVLRFGCMVATQKQRVAIEEFGPKSNPRVEMVF